MEWIYRIYWNDLQATVQLIQQWWAMNGKSKNPVIAQFTRLDASAGLLVYAGVPPQNKLQWQWKNGCCKGKQTKRKSFFLLCPYMDFKPKMGPRIKVCVPASRSWSKADVFPPQRYRLEVDNPLQTMQKYFTDVPSISDCSSFQM